MATTPVTTQELNPGKAVSRTVFAAAVGLFPLLNGILAVCSAWLVEYTPIIPVQLYVILNGVLVAALALTALVTRVLAVPGVNDWLRTHVYARWLAPDGKHEA